MYGLFINRLTISPRIGIHDFESEPQTVHVDVSLVVEGAYGGDEIGGVVDYDFIRREVAAAVAEGHINLQETLCGRILDACRARPGVRAVRVQTEKPDVYPDARGVGCRMLWIDPQVDSAEVALLIR